MLGLLSLRRLNVSNYTGQSLHLLKILSQAFLISSNKHIVSARDRLFVPFLLHSAGCLTAVEIAEWCSDRRATDLWGAHIALAAQQVLPLSVITAALAQRIALADDDNAIARGSVSLDILSSPDTHHDLGFSHQYLRAV